jgi:hypothetical protein
MLPARNWRVEFLHVFSIDMRPWIKDKHYIVLINDRRHASKAVQGDESKFTGHFEAMGARIKNAICCHLHFPLHFDF